MLRHVSGGWDFALRKVVRHTKSVTKMGALKNGQNQRDAIFVRSLIREGFKEELISHVMLAKIDLMWVKFCAQSNPSKVNLKLNTT